MFVQCRLVYEQQIEFDKFYWTCSLLSSLFMQFCKYSLVMIPWLTAELSFPKNHSFFLIRWMLWSWYSTVLAAIYPISPFWWHRHMAAYLMLKWHAKLFVRLDHSRLFSNLFSSRSMQSAIKSISKYGDPRTAWSKNRSVSVLIKSCHCIQENTYRNPIIDEVHAPTKVSDCTKYDWGPLYIVGCGKVVTRAGWTDGRIGGRTYGAGHDNTFWPK